MPLKSRISRCASRNSNAPRRKRSTHDERNRPTGGQTGAQQDSRAGEWLHVGRVLPASLARRSAALPRGVAGSAKLDVQTLDFSIRSRGSGEGTDELAGMELIAQSVSSTEPDSAHMIDLA